MYLIVAFREGEPDRHFLLREGACLIGRVPEANLILPDSTVSRKHAIMRIDNGRVLVEDQDSVNGVFVNGEQVRAAAVKEGDFITVGAYTVVLRAFRDSEGPGIPKGKTFFIGFDAARRLHEKSFESRIPKKMLALYRAALLFSEPFHFSELVRQVLELILDSLSAHRGIVITSAGERPTPQIISSVCRENTPELKTLDSRLINYVINTRTALLTEDVNADPRFHCVGAAVFPDAGSAMCVPLCGSGDALGVLYVDARRETPAFTAKDLEFLSALGHIVGVVVENNLLNRQMARQERFAVLGQAVAGISHDVRNLLTGIQAGVDMLEAGRGNREPEREVKISRIVRNCLGQIDAYLNDMMTFLRESEIHRAPASINEIIQDAINALENLAEDRKVRLLFQEGGFESANIDRLQIHRVVVNLIKNGIEACETRGGLVRVSVSRKADTLIIQVADNGIGIAPEDIPRLSEPFFSVNKKTGTGLGLAVSYQIVEKHGGKITVVSELGKGTIFTVVLPESFPQKAPTLLSKRHTLLGETPFRKCPTCNAVWFSQDDFLADRDVNLIGYQARLEELELGFFFFNHACGTTLAAPAGDFRHLYNGPVFTTRKTGTDECPGHCLRQDELSPCPAQCECAYVREVVQILKNWPKR